MIKKVQYETIEERAIIITENSTMFIKEEQNIREGNFLIFTDELTEVENLKDEIAKLKDENTTMKQAIDELILGGTI